MPRKQLFRDNFYPYHVYNRSIESNFYPINTRVVWNKSVELLHTLKTEYGAKIHLFVLMSNHYHLLISTPRENLDECMWYYQSCFANWICKITERKIYSFESRYKWSIIKDSHHYQTVYKYVARNPIRAGLSSKVDNYSYSSFRHAQLDGLAEDHEFIASSSANDFVKWLNEDTAQDVLDKTRRGLRHKVYTPPARLRGQKGVAPLS